MARDERWREENYGFEESLEQANGNNPNLSKTKLNRKGHIKSSELETQSNSCSQANPTSALSMYTIGTIFSYELS